MRIRRFPCSRVTAAATAVLLLLAAGVWLPAPVASASPSFRFSAAGDFGSWGGLSASLRELKKTGSDFALALGDLSYGGESEVEWCQEFKSAFPNVEIVAGNHDTGDTLPGEGNINNFTAACPFALDAPLTGVYGKQYYFDYPRNHPLVRFVLISPDLVFVVDDGEHYLYTVDTPRYDWTRGAIDSARAAGIPWVIVGMHKTCLGTGEHECETRTDILNLLLSEKVDLILQAHTHHYARTKQLALNPATCTAVVEDAFLPGCVVHDGGDRLYHQGAGSVITIQGTGGRELDPFNVTNPYAPYFAAWMDNTTVGTGKGVLTYDVSAGHISMHTNFNGTYTDSFTMTRPVGTALIQTVVLLLPILSLAGMGVAAMLVWRMRRPRKTPRGFRQ